MLRLGRGFSPRQLAGRLDAIVSGKFGPGTQRSVERAWTMRRPSNTLWKGFSTEGGKATLSGSFASFVAGQAAKRAGSAEPAAAQRVRVKVLTMADKVARNTKRGLPIAVFVAPLVFFAVAVVGQDVLSLAVATAREDFQEVLAEDWNDEKVQEAIYCFVEESVVPKLVQNVADALVKAGDLPAPAEGEEGAAVRESNAKTARELLREAKFNTILSWKVQKAVIGGPGPIGVMPSFIHPLPVSFVNYREVVNANAPISVRVKGISTKPLVLTAHFVRDDPNYYRLEAVSVVDAAQDSVAACLYTHDVKGTMKSMPSRFFEMSIRKGGDDAEQEPAPRRPREHAVYTPTAWWDGQKSEDQSIVMHTGKDKFRLVGSQKPRFPALSNLLAHDAMKLQSRLPALDYMVRKARLNEVLGSSLSEADTLVRLQSEACAKGVAEMYMAICKTSQDAFRQTQRIEPGFLDCFAEGIREFCVANLPDEGLAALETFVGSVRNTKDEGAIIVMDLCRVSLLMTASKFEEAIAVIEATEKRIAASLGDMSYEYANAQLLAAEAYNAIGSYKRAAACSRHALMVLGNDDVDESVLVATARANLYAQRHVSGRVTQSFYDPNENDGPRSLGHFLVHAAYCRAQGIDIGEPRIEGSEVEVAIAEEYLTALAWNKPLVGGLDRDEAKELDWTKLEEACVYSDEALRMESKLLNVKGRPYCRTTCKLSDDRSSVVTSLEGHVTLDSDVKVGSILQIAVNGQEPQTVVVDDEINVKGFQFCIPLEDLSHPTHILMELFDNNKALKKSVSAVGLVVPVRFYSTSYGIDELEDHFLCHKLFDAQLGPEPQTADEAASL